MATPALQIELFPALIGPPALIQKPKIRQPRPKPLPADGKIIILSRGTWNTARAYGNVFVCRYGEVTFYVRDRLRGGRQLLELCAPDWCWQALAQKVHQADNLHRPVMQNPKFTIKWALRQNLDCSRMSVGPLSFGEACAFTRNYHRHHRPPVGHKFSLGLWRGPDLCGVAIVGRPVARLEDNGATLEVTRLCTDGVRNGCSKLYGAAWQEARRRGYRRVITYILGSEPGTSLKAAGWTCLGPAGGGSWNTPSRPRSDKHPTEGKRKYEIRVRPAGLQPASG